MPPISDPDPIYFPDDDAFRAWMEEHHETAEVVWVGYHKRSTGEPSMTWTQSVEVALCFGWIDGIRKSVDERRYTIRFTPRKPTSKWSHKNVESVKRLLAEGRMQPAGMRAYEAREAVGVYSYEQRHEAELPADYERRFRSHAEGWAFFESQPPGYRKTAIHWVVSAKREATRERRLATLIEDSAAGQRIGPLRR